MARGKSLNAISELLICLMLASRESSSVQNLHGIISPCALMPLSQMRITTLYGENQELPWLGWWIAETGPKQLNKCTFANLPMKKALFQLHLAVLLAGFTGILGKLISLREGPLVWYRMGMTTLVMFLFLLWKRKLKKISLKEILGIAYVGFLLGIHWLCFYGSIKYSNVSIALVCFSASAFFSAFLDPLILKHRFSFQEILLSLIAILGIYIIMHFDKRYTTGIILGLLAAFFSALFTVLSKGLTQKHDPYTMTLYELGAGFVFVSFLLPFYLDIFPHTAMIPTPADWLYLLILSVVCTVWAFVLAFSSLKKVSSFTTNLTYNLEPVYGILLAFLIFHENEHLNKNFYVGFSLIILSVALQSLRMLQMGKRLQRKLPARFKIPWG